MGLVLTQYVNTFENQQIEHEIVPYFNIKSIACIKYLTLSWSISVSPVMTILFSIRVSDIPPFTVCKQGHDTSWDTSYQKYLRDNYHMYHFQKRTDLKLYFGWTSSEQCLRELKREKNSLDDRQTWQAATLSEWLSVSSVAFVVASSVECWYHKLHAK